MQPNHSILFPYVETLRKHHILPPSMQRNHSLNISDHFLCKDVSFRKLLFPLLGSCCVSSLSEQKAAVCPLHTVHGGRRRARRHQHSQPQTVAWHNSDSLRWAYRVYVDVCQHLSCMCKYLCVCVCWLSHQLLHFQTVCRFVVALPTEHDRAFSSPSEFCVGLQHANFRKCKIKQHSTLYHIYCLKPYEPGERTDSLSSSNELIWNVLFNTSQSAGVKTVPGNELLFKSSLLCFITYLCWFFIREYPNPRIVDSLSFTFCVYFAYLHGNTNK